MLVQSGQEPRSKSGHLSSGVSSRASTVADRSESRLKCVKAVVGTSKDEGGAE